MQKFRLNKGSNIYLTETKKRKNNNNSAFLTDFKILYVFTNFKQAYLPESNGLSHQNPNPR